jgi:N-succinyldiaminopimelate aminotransferase
MPRFPSLSPALASMPGNLFSRLVARIPSMRGEVYPLHLGDSWLDPPEGASLRDIGGKDLNRYASPHGHPTLLDALSRRYGVSPNRLLVTAGATGALDAIAGTLLDPGDEVIVLAPYWPLIRGIVASRRGVPVEVDFLLGDEPIAARVERAVTDRTVAVYVNSPHNPTGRVLDGEEVDALVDVARRRDLWILADAVYEHHAYTRPHVSFADRAPERTFEAHSFSKAWAMAGYRCGFAIGPADELARVRAASTHTFFAAPTASQLAGVAAMHRGADWLAASREAYRSCGAEAARRLSVEPPEGGTFLFVDVGSALDGRGMEGFLHDCADRNLLLAPGTSCGAAYDRHLRLCFTAAAPEVVLRGVDVLAELLGR